MPFDIPDSWEWTKIGDIAYGVGNKNNQVLAREIKKVGKYPVVSQGAELIDGYADDANKVVDIRPLVMFGDHTRNVKYIDFPFIIGADGTKFLKPIILSVRYLYYLLSYVADNLRNRGYARHFSLLVKEYLPLPPLQEQHRIVEKVEEILSRIEECKKAHERYTSILSKSPGNLRERLIQAAIQGKLVSQDENDEPASVLLERIAKERAAKLGKKAAKSMSRIERRGRETYEIFPNGSEKDITKEIPFDIPNSWEWCRLDAFCEYGRVPSVKASDCASNSWVLDLEDIAPHSGYISRRISAKERTSTSNKYSFKKGMVLYSKLRPYLNKVIVAEEAGCCTTEIIPISVFANSNPYYFQRLLMSPYFVSEINNDAYGVKMPRADTQKIKAFLVPLPPLQEQHRIVERLDALLKLVAVTK